MRGKKYSDEDKEKALALLATNSNILEISKQIGIPESTLRTWKEQAEKDEEFTKLRAKKKAEFVEKAWQSIEKALKLGERRLERALKHEAELDELIEEIEADSKMNGNLKATLIMKIRTLQIQGIRDISTFVGTLYDKQALAAGEATGRQEHTGRDGGPIEVSNLTPEERKARIDELIQKRGT